MNNHPAFRGKQPTYQIEIPDYSGDLCTIVRPRGRGSVVTLITSGGRFEIGSRYKGPARAVESGTRAVQFFEIDQTDGGVVGGVLVEGIAKPGGR